MFTNKSHELSFKAALAQTKLEATVSEVRDLQNRIVYTLSVRAVDHKEFLGLLAKKNLDSCRMAQNLANEMLVYPINFRVVGRVQNTNYNELFKAPEDRKSEAVKKEDEIKDSKHAKIQKQSV